MAKVTKQGWDVSSVGYPTTCADTLSGYCLAGLDNAVTEQRDEPTA